MHMRSKSKLKMNFVINSRLLLNEAAVNVGLQNAPM